MKTSRPDFVCGAGLHRWESRAEAVRCCNGWIRMFVPFLYGRAHVDRSRWYEEGPLAMFVLTLIPVHDQVEIAKLNGLLSDQLREKTVFLDLVEN